MQQVRDPIGDRQTKTESLSADVFATAEFLEDRLLIDQGDTWSGVMHFNTQSALRATHAEQDSTRRRIAHRIGQEVLQDPSQQLRIGMHPGAGGDEGERQSMLAGQRAEFRRQRFQHFAQREIARFRHQPARLQTRHVQQPGQQVGGGIQRAADLLHRFALSRIGQLLRQRIGEQVRGMQRLQQVVADRGEEAALGVVGVLGLALGGFQQRGALIHALFQRLVGLLELTLRQPRGGDVGIGGDEAAAGHRVAADFHHAAIGEHALGQVRRAGAHEGQASLQGGLVRAAVRHPLQGPAGELGDRAADLQQLIGKAEYFHVTAIPRDQALFAIDHADPLAHVLQRRFQHLLVETQVLRGLADDRRDRIQFPALAPRRIQQQARGCGTEHGGEFTFQP